MFVNIYIVEVNTTKDTEDRLSCNNFEGFVHGCILCFFLHFLLHDGKAFHDHKIPLHTFQHNLVISFSNLTSIHDDLTISLAINSLVKCFFYYFIESLNAG